MTNAQAKERWCPMVRIVIGPSDIGWQGRAYTNRMQDVKHGLTETRCLGSECALWRRYFPEGSCDAGECGLIVPVPVSSVI